MTAQISQNKNGLMGRSGGKLMGEVSSYNSDITNERVHKWLENQISKPHISQSMMHLNLIGHLDADDKVNINFKTKQQTSCGYINRRNSDIHRYLQNYFEANDNSLQIGNKYTSMINLNKNEDLITSNLPYKNQIIKALKVTNLGGKRNQINDSIISANDFKTKEGSNSSDSRDYNIDDPGVIINMNDYENLKVRQNSEEKTNDYTNSESSHNSNEIRNEDFLNQLYALQQTYQLKDVDDLNVENKTRNYLSSSESFESLSEGERIDDQNVSEDETTFNINANENQIISDLGPNDTYQTIIGETNIVNKVTNCINYKENQILLHEAEGKEMIIESASLKSLNDPNNSERNENITGNQLNNHDVTINSENKLLLTLPDSQMEENLIALKKEITLIIDGKGGENVLYSEPHEEINRIENSDNCGNNSTQTISVNDGNTLNSVIKVPAGTVTNQLVKSEVEKLMDSETKMLNIEGENDEIGVSGKKGMVNESVIHESQENDNFKNNISIEGGEEGTTEPKEFYQTKNNAIGSVQAEDCAINSCLTSNKSEEIDLGKSGITKSVDNDNINNQDHIKIRTTNFTPSIKTDIAIENSEVNEIKNESLGIVQSLEIMETSTEYGNLQRTNQEIKELQTSNIDEFKQNNNFNTSNDISLISESKSHNIQVMGSADFPDNSSINSPVTIIHNTVINDDKSQLLTFTSDGNSDKDISPLPTDSEKDFSSISEDAVVNAGVNDKNQPSNETLHDSKFPFLQENSLNNNSNQLLNLLKESLTKEDVVERIVSTLFQSVLRASVDLQSLNESVQRIPSDEKKSSETSSNFAPSESEENSDGVFYEAEDSEDNRNKKKETQLKDKKSTNVLIKHTRKFNEEENVKESHSQNNGISNEITNNCDNINEIFLSDEKMHEREIRRILAEGLVEAYDQAELAVQLMEMNFDEEQSVTAAKECSSLQTALIFLQQECHLCAGKYSLKEMVSMLECDHRCCIECANNYFTLQITERSINDCVCPFCKEPDFNRLGEDQVIEYFSNLDIFLKAMVKEKVHELFQRKLRDRTLMQDPNFKWCVKCSSGFIANPRQKRLICPDCKTITCAKCGRAWEKEHEKMTCEEYATWKEYNDPENQLSRHLAENGITCPKCNNRYVLAKGGCMHLTCPQCKYEFCSGCSKQFLMGSKCNVSDYCEKLGLHSHHPRNCLFYLRDKEPATLQKLLDDNNIVYKRNEENTSTKCRIQLLKETADGLVEGICGYPIENQGLCRTHYLEHLVSVLKNNKIDPAPAMDLTEAQQELRRHGKTLPTRPEGTNDQRYLDSCIKMVLEEIPLE